MPPDAIQGITLFHEYLSIRLNPGQEAATDDVDNVVREVRVAATEGVGCIVDGGHADMRRDMAALRRVATETGVHVVASGGYYMQRYYPPEVAMLGNSVTVFGPLLLEAGVDPSVVDGIQRANPLRFLAFEPRRG